MMECRNLGVKVLVLGLQGSCPMPDTDSSNGITAGTAQPSTQDSGVRKQGKFVLERGKKPAQQVRRLGTVISHPP